MALYWPVAWSYWWNKPLAGGLEQSLVLVDLESVEVASAVNISGYDLATYDIKKASFLNCFFPPSNPT
jgi:hypothetical protein